MREQLGTREAERDLAYEDAIVEDVTVSSVVSAPVEPFEDLFGTVLRTPIPEIQEVHEVQEVHEPWRPAIHLPLSDPYQAPEGYVIKANTHSGLYYTPESALYNNTLHEVWFATEELARANGFVKAPE